MLSRLQEKIINFAVNRQAKLIMQDLELIDLLKNDKLIDAVDNLIPAARDQYGNWYVEQEKE